MEAGLRATSLESHYLNSGKRYHLLEIKTFSGKIKEYHMFWQKIPLRNKREQHQDKRDKLLFVLRHHEGNAKMLVIGTIPCDSQASLEAQAHQPAQARSPPHQAHQGDGRGIVQRG